MYNSRLIYVWGAKSKREELNEKASQDRAESDGLCLNKYILNSLTGGRPLLERGCRQHWACYVPMKTEKEQGMVEIGFQALSVLNHPRVQDMQQWA